MGYYSEIFGDISDIYRRNLLRYHLMPQLCRPMSPTHRIHIGVTSLILSDSVRYSPKRLRRLTQTKIFSGDGMFYWRHVGDPLRLMGDWWETTRRRVYDWSKLCEFSVKNGGPWRSTRRPRCNPGRIRPVLPELRGAVWSSKFTLEKKMMIRPWFVFVNLFSLIFAISKHF